METSSLTTAWLKLVSLYRRNEYIVSVGLLFLATVVISLLWRGFPLWPISVVAFFATLEFFEKKFGSATPFHESFDADIWLPQNGVVLPKERVNFKGNRIFDLPFEEFKQREFEEVIVTQDQTFINKVCYFARVPGQREGWWSRPDLYQAKYKLDLGWRSLDEVSYDQHYQVVRLKTTRYMARFGPMFFAIGAVLWVYSIPDLLKMVGY